MKAPQGPEHAFASNRNGWRKLISGAGQPSSLHILVVSPAATTFLRAATVAELTA